MPLTLEQFEGAPPEPSLDEVIAAVKAKWGKCTTFFANEGSNSHWRMRDAAMNEIGRVYCGALRGDEPIWRAMYARLEAVEGEAKPRHKQDIGVIGLPVATPTAPKWNEAEALERVAKACEVPQSEAEAVAAIESALRPMTPTAPPEVADDDPLGIEMIRRMSQGHLKLTKDLVHEAFAEPPEVAELPPLDVTDDDWSAAKNTGRQQFVTPREAELACRERQLFAEIAAHAQTKAERDRLLDAAQTLLDYEEPVVMKGAENTRWQALRAALTPPTAEDLP